MLQEAPRQLPPEQPALSEDRQSLQMVQTSQPRPFHDVGTTGKLQIDKAHIEMCLQPCRHNRWKTEEGRREGQVTGRETVKR